MLNYNHPVIFTVTLVNDGIVLCNI